MSRSPAFHEALDRCPLIAILRGIVPAEATAMADALVDTGISILEVPLNSPDPIASIGQMVRRHPGAMIGAGTVMTTAEVDAVADIGGRLIVMPHADLEIVRHAKARSLVCVPGVATPTEAFAALRVGADALKLFPGEMLTPAVVKAMRAVLPRDCRVIPVGGVGVDNLAAYWAAGANGFGIGSALFQPGRSVAETAARGRALVARMQEIRTAGAG